jgi:predicted outer membrane repeat protein
VLPDYGNPGPRATLPAEAKPVDTSRPDRVIGTGTPASCTSAAVITAVAAGGISTFNCGADPVTIVMAATAKVRNNIGRTVLDGGSKITLSGGGVRRILYMNTCDSSLGRSKTDCLYQTDTQLIIQNLTLADGNSTGEKTEGGGGGAILVRGGLLKVVNSRFVRNRCDTTGPDLGGAAIRITIQYHRKPNYIVGSTFGGAQGQGGSCSNGGAISGLHASLAIYNSVLSHNNAIGKGANPAREGTPGGGSGGAIYTDGKTFTIGIYASTISDNRAKEGGGAIFMVSNDRTGTLTIDSSTLQRNPSDGFQNSPGIFFIGLGKPKVTASIVK